METAPSPAAEPEAPLIEPEEPCWRPNWPLETGSPDLRSRCDYLSDKVFTVLKDDDNPIYDEDPEYDAVVDKEVQRYWDYYSNLALHGLPELDKAFEELRSEIIELDAERATLRSKHSEASGYVEAVLGAEPFRSTEALAIYFEAPPRFEDVPPEALLRYHWERVLPYWDREGDVEDGPRGVSLSLFLVRLAEDIPTLTITSESTWGDLNRALVNEAETYRFLGRSLHFKRHQRYFAACVLDGVRHVARKSGKIRLFSRVDITGQAPDLKRRAPWSRSSGRRPEAKREADFRAIVRAIDSTGVGATLDTIYMRAFGSEHSGADDRLNSWHRRISRGLEDLNVSTSAKDLDNKKKDPGPWNRIPPNKPQLQVDLLRTVAHAYVNALKTTRQGRRQAVAAAVEKWVERNERNLEKWL